MEAKSQVRLDSLKYVSQDGSSTSLRTVLTDITKRKHAEEALLLPNLVTDGSLKVRGMGF